MSTPLTISRVPNPVRVMLHQLSKASPEECAALAAAYQAGPPRTAVDSDLAARLDELVRHRLEESDHGTDVHTAALTAITAAHARAWPSFDPDTFASQIAPWVEVFGPIETEPARIDWYEPD